VKDFGSRWNTRKSFGLLWRYGENTPVAIDAQRVERLVTFGKNMKFRFENVGKIEIYKLEKNLNF